MLMRTALVAALCAGPVAAQQCAPRSDFEVELADRFGEIRQTAALGSVGQLIEVWVNLETRTWTATLTDQNGLTCIVSYGTNWQMTPQGEPA